MITERDYWASRAFREIMMAILPATARAKITNAPEVAKAKGFETSCAADPGVSAAAGVEKDEEGWV